MEEIKYRYSFGCTPENIIRECLPETYPMELVGEDWQVFEILQNQGIDSHLEAMACDNRDSVKVNNYPIGKYNIQKLGCGLSKDAMVCFLRRLYEFEFETEELESNAWSLRSCILDTIGIEEI
jgi:hypothetical protein